MEKKAVAFTIAIEAVDISNAAGYSSRIMAYLNDGWDILSSHAFGIETGGGHAGAGKVEIYTALVKYEYFTPE